MSGIHREQTVTVKGHSCRLWEKSPRVYFHKWQASIENKLQLSGDIAVDVGKRVLAFMKINARHISRTNCDGLLLCPLTVAVCSRLMPAVYFHKRQDSFPNVYCYVIWQSQFLLDGCLAFMKINARTLFPTSTAMSPDSRSLFSMDAWRLWK